MTTQTARWGAAAIAVAGILSLAACGKSGPATPVSGEPVYGGTLRIVANGGPDHLDTVQAYIVPDYILERAYARQLVSYRTIPVTGTSGPAWQKAITVVPRRRSPACRPPTTRGCTSGRAATPRTTPRSTSRARTPAAR